MGTLATRGHQGRIVALSRSGRTPSAYHLAETAPSTQTTRSDEPELHPAEQIWQTLKDDEPEFVQRHGPLNSIRAIVRALRGDIAHSDQHWSTSFDSLRNSAHAIWPKLTTREKQRFFRHLKRRYDVHRYRYPPATKSILDGALKSGQIEYKAGIVTSDRVSHGDALRLTLTHARGEQQLDADWLVNCTAANHSVLHTTNPLLRQLLDNKLIAPSETGVGLAANHIGQSIDADGQTVPGLYLLGPLVYGELGEAINVPFITRQIVQIIQTID